MRSSPLIGALLIMVSAVLFIIKIPWSVLKMFRDHIERNYGQ